jgi:hypothetical protein
MFIYKKTIHRRIQRHHLLLLTLESMVVKGECVEIESTSTILPKTMSGEGISTMTSEDHAPWAVPNLPCMVDGVGAAPNQGGQLPGPPAVACSRRGMWRAMGSGPAVLDQVEGSGIGEGNCLKQCLLPTGQAECRVGPLSTSGVAGSGHPWTWAWAWASFREVPGRSWS